MVGSDRRRSSRAFSASDKPRKRFTNDGSLAPDRNSISRNCTDWNPLAGDNRCRNVPKSCGVIVSRMSTCWISVRSMVCTRRSRCCASQSSPDSIASRDAVISCSTCLNHSS